MLFLCSFVKEKVLVTITELDSRLWNLEVDEPGYSLWFETECKKTKKLPLRLVNG